MNIHTAFRPAGIILVMLVMSASLPAQQEKTFTLDTMRDPSFAEAFAVPRTWWLSDNAAFVYGRRMETQGRVLERLDPATGKRVSAYDAAKARESFGKLYPGEEPPSLPPLPAAFSDDGAKGFYLIKGDIFVLDLAAGTIRRITRTPEIERAVNFSPDGMHLAYVRENDLYTYDLGTNSETRLTRDGSETILNGTLSWVYWEEIFGRRDIGYWWSNDSRSIAFLRTDDSKVSLEHYVDITPWTPTVTTQRYPKVGEPNPSVRVGFDQ